MLLSICERADALVASALSVIGGAPQGMQDHPARYAEP